MNNNKQHKTSKFLLHGVLTGLLISACASALAEEVGVKTDPLEALNRPVFSFNDTVDNYFLKPIATLYNKIIPKPLNQGIHNFFNNIGELPTIANDLLQFHFYQSANDFWRFAINSTVGIGGLFDMATRMKLPHYTNDFGMTLATWGYQNSTYIVWPFFGPSTLRDGVSMPVDYFAFSIYPHIPSETNRYALYSLGVVDKRAQLLKFQPLFEEVTVDKYVFMRNAYLQRRAYQIEQNNHRSYKDQSSPGDNETVAANQSEENKVVQDKKNAKDLAHSM
ncbi:MAG: VacJ family lipoprotein [Gammaproteobacteria bacterium]|nr:VacJ family lipoprotein [Gammaproteobacteria bacterium]